MKRYAVSCVMYRWTGAVPESFGAVIDAASPEEAVGIAATMLWKEKRAALLTDAAVIDLSVEPPKSVIPDDVIIARRAA